MSFLSLSFVPFCLFLSYFLSLINVLFVLVLLEFCLRNRQKGQCHPLYLYYTEVLALYYLGGASLLNPPKIKPPIADFIYPPWGFKGVIPPKMKLPFDFLTPKGTDAGRGLKTVLPSTYLSKFRKFCNKKNTNQGMCERGENSEILLI